MQPILCHLIPAIEPECNLAEKSTKHILPITRCSETNPNDLLSEEFSMLSPII